MRSKLRRITYKLNESNSNNPAILLVGQDININIYDKDGSVTDSYVGTVEEITNEGVIVRELHTQETRTFVMNGYSYKDGGIEFVYINDPKVRFVRFD
jgi:hypothetical protein